MGALLDELRGTKPVGFLIATATGAAVLLASLANYLTHNDYPYFRPEFGLIVLVILAVSAVMAGLYIGQRQWGRSILEGFLAALFVDLNSNLFPLIVGVGLSVALITAWKRISLMGPMAILGTVVLLTTLLGIGGRSPWLSTSEADPKGRSLQASGQPAVIHLILDEHLGIEGFLDDRESQRVAEELRSSYLASGFTLYGGAYTQHYHSSNAIPYILNFGARLGEREGERGVKVGASRHLESLVDRGYRLTIFQSDFAEFCKGARFSACSTYISYSLRPTLKVSMTTSQRAELIAHKFMSISRLVYGYLLGWNFTAARLERLGIAAPLYNFHSGHSNAVATLQVMDEVIARARTVRPGEALFAHLLLPHHPYVTRSDCSYLPWGPWEGLRTDVAIEEKRRLYYDQVRCTNRKIRALLSAVERSPAGKTSVIIIHGDHGSRMSKVIPREQSIGRFDDEDLVASFSTLFAVRAPGLKADYLRERWPISALLHDFTASEFRSAPRPALSQPRSIFLTDEDWEPIRTYPLPPSWLNFSDRPKLGQGEKKRVSP